MGSQDIFLDLTCRNSAKRNINKLNMLTNEHINLKKLTNPTLALPLSISRSSTSELNQSTTSSKFTAPTEDDESTRNTTSI